MPLVLVKSLCSATATLLVMSLMGCAASCPTLPAESRTLPPPPSLSTPLPSVNYSLSVAESERKSQQKLMGTRLMSERSEKPGQ